MSAPPDAPAWVFNPPAGLLDLAMWPMRRLRPGVVGAATGEVLEIGLGSGLNLPFYGSILSLHAVEPDPALARAARRRADRLGRPLSLLEVSAEVLPFPDARFDTVVATFVLCTIPSPERALTEALRVLRPEGRLLFAEHGRSPHPSLYALQRALDPCWCRLAGGCHLTRDPVGLLQGAGAAVQSRPRGSAWSLVPVVTGEARRGENYGDASPPR